MHVGSGEEGFEDGGVSILRKYLKTSLHIYLDNKIVMI